MQNPTKNPKGDSTERERLNTENPLLEKSPPREKDLHHHVSDFTSKTKKDEMELFIRNKKSFLPADYSNIQELQKVYNDQINKRVDRSLPYFEATRCDSKIKIKTTRLNN